MKDMSPVATLEEECKDETTKKTEKEEEDARERAKIWEMEEQKFAVWKVIFQPRVLVRKEPKKSGKPVGLLYPGDEVIVSPEPHWEWLRIYEGPAHAKLPPEAWVCWDARADGLGYMLKE